MSERFLVVGLGNKGKAYAGTRHNIGFDVIDIFAQKQGLSFIPKYHSEWAEWSFRGKTIHFLKPMTYMNESGVAVKRCLDREKIPLTHLLVVVDDLNLELGRLRLRFSGSAGGHNGLKSIEACVQCSGYARLRLGIGNDYAQGQQVDFVLGRWEEEEKKILYPALAFAGDLIPSFILHRETALIKANNYRPGPV